MSESLPLLTAYAERPDNLFALLYRYRVVVPAFQRQYVQGADGPKAREVRENFIRSLLAASRPAGRKLHLHFIYGPIDTEGEDAFTPVDGQQRLTTLWLLARYAVERLAPEADGDRKGVLKLLARFSYAGRRHAERFCQALTTEGNGWNLKNSPDQSIPLQPWFWPAWREDETVDSMLRMLDAIHAHWAESDPRNVLEALHTDITFSLQIDSFADDIYMKMNARGLQLTQWENLKGRFAELLAAHPLRQDWLGNFRSPSEQDKRLEDKAGTCQRIVDQLTQSTDPISPRQVWSQVIEVLSNCYFCKAKSQMKQSDGQVDASRGWLPDDAFLALMARLLALQLRIGKDEAPEDSRDVSEPKDVPEDLGALADFTAADWNNVDLPFVPFGGFATALGSVDVDVFAQDVLRMLDFVLTDAIAGLPSPYWQQGRTLFESVFHPRNLNERDLAWLVCMWRKEHPGATEDAFSRALRCMWNILENDPRHAAERLGQFQRFLIQSRGPALYDEANAAMPASAPLQWQEEAAKAQVYNGHKDLVGRLQEAECHLHGRVRLGILDLENGSAEIRPERLGKLDEMFRAWNSKDDMVRKVVIMNLVAAQAYGAMDVFELNTSDDTLRAMLTNRNDKDIQPHLMRIDVSRVPDKPFGEAGYSDWQLKDGRPCRWLRDWRQALLDVFNGKNGHGVYAGMIWGRSVRWHGASGLYYLYSGKSIKWSLPINDWRMELMADEGLAKWFKKMVEAEYAPGAKLDYEWHVVINDGNSIHRGLPSDLADDLTPPRVSPGLYFMQDRIYVIVNPGPGRTERNVCLLDDVRNLRDIPDCVANNLQELSRELKASEQLEGGASAPREG